MSGARVWKSPEYWYINYRQHSELDSRRVLEIFKIRSQSDAAGRNSLWTTGCFPKLPLLTDEVCQHVSVTSSLVFQKEGPLLTCFGYRGGYLEKNLSSRMHVQRTKVP